MISIHPVFADSDGNVSYHLHIGLDTLETILTEESGVIANEDVPRLMASICRRAASTSSTALTTRVVLQLAANYEAEVEVED